MHCRSTWHVASQRLRASKFRHSTILMGLEHQRLMFGRCGRPIFAASGPVERRGSWASDSHLPRISLQPQTPTNKLQTDVCLAQSPILEIVEEGSSRTTFLLSTTSQTAPGHTFYSASALSDHRLGHSLLSPHPSHSSPQHFCCLLVQHQSWLRPRPKPPIWTSRSTCPPFPSRLTARRTLAKPRTTARP